METATARKHFGDVIPSGESAANAAEGPAFSGVPGAPSLGTITRRGALKELIDMGDAPSFVCGSIMTRNESCYRCMSCGSTSECS